MSNLIRLKDGKEIRIRPILRTDVISRHEFFVHLSLEQAGVIHTIDEIEIHTHETEERISDFLNNRRGLWLVAINPKKKIVGEIDIFVKGLSRIRHNGVLTIGILSDYQGRGLGKMLMTNALAWAQRCGLLRVELSVFANNVNARALYAKFGFEKEGIRKNFLRHSYCTFEDDLMLAKYLTPGADIL